MKNRNAAIVCLVLPLAITASAHSGDRLYPIPEITDEMLERIQLHDGSADEWYDLAGEPTMSLVDFRLYGEIPDPSDLDFRIWLAWRDDPDRLYVAFLYTDDVHFNDRGGHDVELQLTVDGDHSGGKGYSNMSFDEAERVWGESQQYVAMVGTATGRPSLYAYYTTSSAMGSGMSYVSDLSEDSWTVSPPFGNAGGGISGENPAIGTIELYVTPYDGWQGNDSRPEDVGVTDLAPGEVIGFAIVVAEVDDAASWDILTPEAVQTEDPWTDVLFHFRADVYLDGLLLPADPADPRDGSAVESVSWGRIKAALDME